jgi:C4-dicarboxylate transporter/malic acid transport protein
MRAYCAALSATDAMPHLRVNRLSEVVRQFTPNWFAVTMGTGVLPIVLVQLPGVGPVLRPLGEGLWWLDVGLFIVFAGIYTTRWALFAGEARRIFEDGVGSMFFGAIPMGLATILSGALAFALPRLGTGVLSVVEPLWWIDVVMAVACGVGIPYLMFTRQEHSVGGMTAVWLLPVAAAEVVATPGAYLAPHLSDPANQIAVLTVGYALWAYSVPISCVMFAVLILRMALHKLPPAGAAASSWLALGPIGTGALDMLVFGADAPAIFTARGLPAVAATAQAVGVLGGVLMWGFGLWWLLLATLITIRYFRSAVPFNLSWWGYTFPLGVYAVVTLRLATILRLAFFEVFGVVLAVGLAAVWTVVMARTIRGVLSGHLFAPANSAPNA